MIGPIGITLRQAEDHFDFILDLTDNSKSLLENYSS